jgi:hypothetical protein
LSGFNTMSVPPFVTAIRYIRASLMAFRLVAILRSVAAPAGLRVISALIVEFIFARNRSAASIFSANVVSIMVAPIASFVVYTGFAIVSYKGEVVVVEIIDGGLLALDGRGPPLAGYEAP